MAVDDPAPSNDQRAAAAEPCAFGSAIKQAGRERLAARQVLTLIISSWSLDQSPVDKSVHGDRFPVPLAKTDSPDVVAREHFVSPKGAKNVTKGGCNVDSGT